MEYREPETFDVKCVMRDVEFLEQATLCDAGDELTYHVGLLMRDRKLGAHSEEIDDVAAMAWRLAHMGFGALVQRRVKPVVCEYVFQRNGRPLTGADRRSAVQGLGKR